MPLFRVFSDLHLEHGEDVLEFCLRISKRNPVDYLILAGDIVNYPSRRTLLPAFIHNISPFYKNIFYVLGNHEYYNNPYFNKGAVMKNVINDYRDICEDIGVILLENEGCYLEHDDIMIYGTTLWSNVSEKAYRRLSDKHAIGPLEIINAHKKAQRGIETFLDNIPQEVIVITHYLPSYRFINKKYHEENSENGINSGFASHSDYLFKPPITDWVYGHTHTPSFKIINGINFWYFLFINL